MFALCLAVLIALAGPPDDGVGEGRKGTFALVHARIETMGPQGTIARGTLVIRDGQIVAVGPEVPVPPDAEVIDATGLTLYPGFIDSGTALGLQEIGSLPETVDHTEIGAATPQMQALTAVNPNAVAIPITRVSGVTTVLTMPRSGLMPGTAALISLHGYTPAQMDEGFRGVVLNFPVTARRGAWDRRPQAEIDKAANDALKALNDLWTEAETYARLDSAFAARPDPNHPLAYAPELRALLPVVRGEVPLLIEVDAAADIGKALDWLAARPRVRALLMGVAEGWRVADRIAAAKIPCLVGPVLAVPTRDADRYDKRYANASLLYHAGVEVALRTGEVENVRNLPFHAGFAAAYGLGPRAALEAVTTVPARLFGVADRLGSLEVGKQATLFAATGDPFEPRTQVQAVFIDGYLLPMVSRQTRLYDEFLQRNPGLQE